MAKCVIDADFIEVCGNINPSGVSDSVMIYNKADWDSMQASGSIVYDTADFSITSIINPTGVQAWRFDVPPNALIPSCNPVVVEGSYTMFEHMVTFPIIQTNQEAKNTQEKMGRNKFVLVYIKETGEAEVLGNDQGLSLSAGAYEPSNTDTGGTLPVELKSARKETKLPITYYDTDDATTLAGYNALNVVGV